VGWSAYSLEARMPQGPVVEVPAQILRWTGCVAGVQFSAPQYGFDT
jgi:hypothetical protein